jgi:hypothetical protein
MRRAFSRIGLALIVLICIGAGLLVSKKVRRVLPSDSAAKKCGPVEPPTIGFTDADLQPYTRVATQAMRDLLTM